MSAPSSPEVRDCLRTGFWTNQNLQDPDFDFLEDVCTGRNTLMDYLHGECTFFALALHDLAGFPVYCIADEDELADRGYPDPAGGKFPLIHDFCVIGDIDRESDSALFLDCRGIIGREQAFLEEFRDFFDGYRIIQYTKEQLDELRTSLWSPASKNHADRYYLEACSYIKHHSQDYIPDWLKEKEAYPCE